MAAKEDIKVSNRMPITILFSLIMLGMLEMNSMTLNKWETTDVAGLRPMLIWAFNDVVSPE